jgi:DNA primase RepB-like protein
MKAGRMARLQVVHEIRAGFPMTGEERKKRGEKSAVIVERLVRIQLRAMGCERFDVGIKRGAGEMILREGQGAIEIEKTIAWLRHENAKGAHIYVRPAGAHRLSLLDDLSSEAIERMKAEGFEPAVVVETSPNNFQAWLNHGQVLDAAISTRAAKQLAERFGGDRSSADWRHFGRLAGFTNPKPERQLPSGMRPFARLRSAKGHIYSKAAEFVAGIRSSDDRQEGQGGEPPKQRRHAGHSGVVTLEEFHRASAYGGDLHRADMAWAKHAAGRGLTFEQIKDELLNGRDLSKKGNRKRQLEYAERTARKAIEQSGALCWLRGKRTASTR